MKKRTAMPNVNTSSHLRLVATNSTRQDVPRPHDDQALEGRREGLTALEELVAEVRAHACQLRVSASLADDFTARHLTAEADRWTRLVDAVARRAALG